MARFTVLYDACVLYPAPLRDLLLQLATTNLFHARWTNQIHDEWTQSLAANRADIADRLQRTRELMNKAVIDCLIEDYQELIAGLSLPDSATGMCWPRQSRAELQLLSPPTLKTFRLLRSGSSGLNLSIPMISFHANLI